MSQIVRPRNDSLRSRLEAMRNEFDQGNLTTPYHSVNTDVGKRIRYL
jgi:hypothetical protein